MKDENESSKEAKGEMPEEPKKMPSLEKVFDGSRKLDEMAKNDKIIADAN